MAIYIKGMKIPTDGSMIFAIRPDGMVEDVMGCYVGKAVPVPEHGRLGDLEKLSERMKALLEKAEDDGFDIGVWWYSTFLRYIEYAPTIIPANKEGE